jgi:WD40 repeat protein
MYLYHLKGFLFLTFRRPIFASMSPDGLIRVWTLEPKDLRCALSTDYSQATTSAISENGQRLALQSNTDTVSVLNIPGGELAFTLHVTDLDILGIARDGQLLAWAKGKGGAIYNFRTQ